jgi:hypothetical protein
MAGMELVVQIDDDIYDQLVRRADEHEFESAEEYSKKILQTVIDELETDTADGSVTDRLSDLGYLD